MVHDIRWVERVKLQKCSRARVVVGGESFEYVATTYGFCCRPQPRDVKILDKGLGIGSECLLQGRKCPLSPGG